MHRCRTQLVDEDYCKYFTEEEKCNCLILIVHILKNVGRDYLRNWWTKESTQIQINFVQLLTNTLLSFIVCILFLLLFLPPIAFKADN